MAATITKTIEYMLPMLASGSAAGVSEGTSFLDSANTVIYIPETTSRAFVSVTLEMVCHDNSATVTANLSGWGLRGSCNSGSNYTTQTLASGYNQSGENMSHIFVVDMTQEFQARFGTGGSGTFLYGYYVDYSAAQTIGNVTAKLYITYEFDHTAHSVRAKTVRIPIESFLGRLSNSAQAVRQTSTSASQIPALTAASNPFLPEASVAIRQAFLELWTNTLPSTTTDTRLILKVDPGGSETTFGLVENGNATPIRIRFLYDVTATDWTSRHELFARHDVAGQTYFAHLGGQLVVNYEYDASTSGSILNSLCFGAFEESGNIQTSASPSGFILEKNITEPDPINLVQSGIGVVFTTSTTSGTFSFSSGSQGYTGYTPTSATGQAGMCGFTQRIDTGANSGSAFSLTRGNNSFKNSWYANTINIMGNVSGYFLLNYTSAVGNVDPDFHTQTRHYLISPQNSVSMAGTNIITSTCRIPSIIPQNYYIFGAMPVLYAAGYTAGTTGAVFQVLASGSGWRTVFDTVAISSNERQPLINYGTSRDSFKRYPNDPNMDRMDIQQQLAWRAGTITAIQSAMTIFLTYHNFNFSVSGSVTGYAGSGSGIEVYFYNQAGDYSGSTLTGASGWYSTNWFNNSVDLFAQAQEDTAHVGSSVKGKAV